MLSASPSPSLTSHSPPLASHSPPPPPPPPPPPSSHSPQATTTAVKRRSLKRKHKEDDEGEVEGVDGARVRDDLLRKVEAYVKGEQMREEGEGESPKGGEDAFWNSVGLSFMVEKSGEFQVLKNDEDLGGGGEEGGDSGSQKKKNSNGSSSCPPSPSPSPPPLSSTSSSSSSSSSSNTVVLTRLKRELFYLLHHMLSLASDEMRAFVTRVCCHAYEKKGAKGGGGRGGGKGAGGRGETTILKEVYTLLLMRESINTILTDLNVSTEDVSLCLLVLLTSGRVPLVLALDALNVKDTGLLYKERLRRAVLRYQTTDATLLDIATQCWIPSRCLYVEISERGIKRKGKFDNFDVALHYALQLCLEGIPFKEALKAENVAEFVDDFERILEHHVGRDIALPLRDYGRRIEDALAACRGEAMSIADAAKEFMVPYSVLCEKVLSRAEEKERDESTTLSDLVFRAPNGNKGGALPAPSPADAVAAVADRVTSLRCKRGLKSRTDKILRAALLSARDGMDLEDVFRLYRINNRRSRNIIKYNVGRADAPLGESYEVRFQKAVAFVRDQGTPVSEAANRFIINHSVLWDFFNVNRMERKRIRALNMAKERRGELPGPAEVTSDDRAETTPSKMRSDGRSGAPLESPLRGEERAAPNSPPKMKEEEEGESAAAETFDSIMAAALRRCRDEGISARQALQRHHPLNESFFDIVAYNVDRADCPIDESYMERLFKATEACTKRGRTLQEAARTFIVNPTTLRMRLNHVAKSKAERRRRKEKHKGGGGGGGGAINKMHTNWERFDVAIQSALRDHKERGLSVDEAAFRHGLTNKKHKDIFEFNARRADPPCQVPYLTRVRRARRASKDEGLTMAAASRIFMVSPYTLWPSRINRKATSSFGKKRKPVGVAARPAPSVSSVLSSKKVARKDSLTAFDSQMRAALRSCLEEGLSLEESCQKHKVVNKRHQKILEFNLSRVDRSALDDPAEVRLQKALKACSAKTMKVIDASREYMISPYLLWPSRTYRKSFRSKEFRHDHPTEEEKRRIKEKLISFDRQFRAALASCRSGMPVREACLKYKLTFTKHEEILAFNLDRRDAPLDVPCEVRLREAQRARLDRANSVADIAKTYMISPHFLWPSKINMKELEKMPSASTPTERDFETPDSVSMKPDLPSPNTKKSNPDMQTQKSTKIKEKNVLSKSIDTKKNLQTPTKNKNTEEVLQKPKLGDRETFSSPKRSKTEVLASPQNSTKALQPHNPSNTCEVSPNPKPVSSKVHTLNVRDVLEASALPKLQSLKRANAKEEYRISNPGSTETQTEIVVTSTHKDVGGGQASKSTNTNVQKTSKSNDKDVKLISTHTDTEEVKKSKTIVTNVDKTHPINAKVQKTSKPTDKDLKPISTNEESTVTPINTKETPPTLKPIDTKTQNNKTIDSKTQTIKPIDTTEKPITTKNIQKPTPISIETDTPIKPISSKIIPISIPIKKVFHTLKPVKGVVDSSAQPLTEVVLSSKRLKEMIEPSRPLKELVESSKALKEELRSTKSPTKEVVQSTKSSTKEVVQSPPLPQKVVEPSKASTVKEILPPKPAVPPKDALQQSSTPKTISLKEIFRIEKKASAHAGAEAKEPPTITVQRLPQLTSTPVVTKVFKTSKAISTTLIHAEEAHTSAPATPKPEVALRIQRDTVNSTPKVEADDSPTMDLHLPSGATFRMKRIQLSTAKLKPTTKKLMIHVSDNTIQLTDANKGCVGRDVKRVSVGNEASSPTSYERRFKLALTACTNMEITRKAAAKKYHVNLEELSKAYESEWTMKFCARLAREASNQ